MMDGMTHKMEQNKEVTFEHELKELVRDEGDEQHSRPTKDP